MALLWTKAHYLLLYAVVGAFLPYLPLYLNEQGMADWQIGWLLSLYGLAVVVMPAILTYLADRKLSNRVLIGACHGLAAAGLFLLATVHRFEGLLLASLLFFFAFTPLISLLDGLTFSTMHAQEREGRRPPAYHRVRIWGSVGFLLPALLLFVLLRFTEATGRAAILVAAGSALLAALTAALLPNDRPTGELRGEAPTLQAWRTLRTRPALNLVGPLFLMFTAISMFYAFYTRYLQELGVGREWAGLIVNIGVAAEIVLILVSGPILRRLGVRGVAILGASCLVLRLGLLAALPSVAVAVWTQLLHGPLVLCLYLLPPMYLNQKATPGHRNSIQGIYGLLCFGLARLTGSLLGGHAAEWDLRWVFGLGAALGTAAALWLLFAFRDEETCRALRYRHAERPGAAAAPV